MAQSSVKVDRLLLKCLKIYSIRNDELLHNNINLAVIKFLDLSDEETKEVLNGVFPKRFQLRLKDFKCSRSDIIEVD